MREINVNFLEEVFSRLIDKLKFDLDKDLEIKTDFYLNIPTSEWTNYSHEVVAESLYDDIDSLKLLTIDKDRPCTYVDFDRFAALLREISQIQNPK